MSRSTDAGNVAMPARAVSSRARGGWMLLALLPGACIEAWVSGVAFAQRLAIVLAAVLVLEWLAGRGRRAMHAWNPQPLLMTAIALCWLPVSLPWWSSAMAGAAAWACAHRFGRLAGGSAFHPAMIGCAIATVFATGEPTPPASDATSSWIAAVFFCAGLGLAAGRCIRWQVPVATWIGAAVVSFAWQASGLQPPPQDTLYAALPALQIAVFFVATDPSSGCRSPRARWAFGFGIGLLGRLALLGFHDGHRAFLGMAGAVLLMNAAAPWLDRRLPRPRRSLAPAA